MRAGNRDGIREPSRDNPKHYGAFNGWNAASPCGYKFRIILFYRRSVNDELGPFYVLRFLTHADRNTVGTDAGERIRFVGVGAGQLITLMKQNFGNRAHSRTADPYEMNPFNL